MKVKVNQDLCSGCGLCSDLCPEIFELDKDDMPRVKTREVPTENKDTCRDAAESCPEEAIQIEE